VSVNVLSHTGACGQAFNDNPYNLDTPALIDFENPASWFPFRGEAQDVTELPLLLPSLCMKQLNLQSRMLVSSGSSTT